MVIYAENLRKNHYSKISGKYAGIGSPSDPNKGISFSCEKGEIFGVIGPDGAGKSTLFKIIATLIYPDSGIARVDNLDVVTEYKKIRNIIGYMPGEFSLYMDLSVEENLTFFATLYGTSIEENYHLIKDIYSQIEPFKTRKAGQLSGGMKQKLALSCALIHKPKVLILDEPTTGVDPLSRKELWDMLKSLKQSGITILISTAYMDEAGLCDNIALMKDGEFLAVDTPQNIINSYNENLWRLSADNMISIFYDTKNYPDIKKCFAFGNEHHFTTRPDFDETDFLIYLQGKNHTNISLNAIEPNIEDCFMALTSDN